MLLNKSGENIKLGLMAPMSGLVEIYGNEIINAGKIAAQQINDQGGVLGRALEIVVVDDGSLPDSAVIAAEKLLDQHQCVAIIGNLLSNSRISVAYRVAEPRKIPYLNFSFYEGSILSRYFFHFAALPNQQIDQMIFFMLNKFGRRMYFAGNNYEWPRGSIHAAKRALESGGGEVVGEQYCPIGIDDQTLDELISQVELSAPDVFVPYFAGKDQVKLLTRFSERGLKNKMAVIMGHYDEVIASQLTPEVRQGFYSCNTYFMNIDSTANKEYLSRLEQLPDINEIWPKGNGILTNFGEGTYVCVNAFATAANTAGCLESEKLIDALETVEVLAPQGKVTMYPDHHAKVNTWLSRCRADGSFDIIKQLGAIEPKLPDRYKHQRVKKDGALDEFRLQSLILEQMSEAVLLVNSEDGKIIYTNSSANSMLGYNLDEMLGLPITQLNEPSIDISQRVSNEIVKTLNQRGRWHGDIQTTKKDGTPIWCSVTVSTFTHPVYGEVWLGVYRDISIQKRVVQELEQERDFATQLLNMAPVIILLLDSCGFIQHVNPYFEKLSGYQLNEIKGKDWFTTFLPERDQKHIRALFDCAVNDNPTKGNINSIVTHSGEELDIEWYDTVLTDEQGNFHQLLVIGQDVTERKQAQEKILSNLEEKEILLREVHHRVKNNLQIISSLLNIQARHTDQDHIQQALQESRERIRSMAMIHERLYRDVDISNVNFLHYLRYLAERLRRIYQGSNCSLCIQVEGDSLGLPIDKAIPCALVAHELISNAVQYAYGEQSVEAQVDVCINVNRDVMNNKQVNLTVRDYGIGLPLDIKNGEPKTTGMIIIYALARQLEGKVAFEINLGTRATLSFPNTNKVETHIS